MAICRQSNPSLPIKHKLTLTYGLTFAIAILMAVASITGLLYRKVVYPTEELANSFVPNDVVNLFIGLPILLDSMWLTHRGQLIGLLFWPGALLFALNNYLVYMFSSCRSMWPS